MKKKVVLSLLVFIMLIVCSHTVFAAGNANISDKFLPNTNPLSESTTINDALYLKYPVSNYYLDGHYGTFDVTGGMQNSLQNSAFQLYTLGVKTNIYVTQYAFDLNVIETFADILDEAVKAFSDVVFWPYVPSAIILLGLWGMYKGFVKNEITTAASDIAKYIGVLAVAIYMLGNMGFLLTTFNNFSRDMGNEMLATAAQLDSGLTNKTSDGALVNFGDNVWSNFVHKPWELMEFGQTDSPHSANFLSKAPGSDERKALYIEGNADFDMMVEEGIGQRYLAITLIYLTGVIYMTFVACLAASVIIAQITACFVAVLAPAVFIMSLWPGWGTIILQRWLHRLAGLMLVKVGLSMVLAIMLVFSSLIFKEFDGYNIIIVSLMQLALVVGIIKERKRLSGLIVDTAQKGPYAAANRIYNREKRDRSASDSIHNVSRVANVGAGIVTKNPNLVMSGIAGGGNAGSGARTSRSRSADSEDHIVQPNSGHTRNTSTSQTNRTARPTGTSGTTGTTRPTRLTRTSRTARPAGTNGTNEVNNNASKSSSYRFKSDVDASKLKKQPSTVVSTPSTPKIVYASEQQPRPLDNLRRHQAEVEAYRRSRQSGNSDEENKTVEPPVKVQPQKKVRRTPKNLTDWDFLNS